MFIYDVETLGVESNSVILSMACIYFNPELKPNFQQMVNSAFFVKFDAKEQVEKYNRKVSQSTLDWWNGQPPEAKNLSFKPRDSDLSLYEGIQRFHGWIKSHKDYKTSTVWARGNLDQIALHSLENDADVETLFPYWMWRDVRTAVDLLSGSNNGYCPVEYPGFDPRTVIKHDPIQDCAYDAMMLMYGVSV